MKAGHQAQTVATSRPPPPPRVGLAAPLLIGIREHALDNRAGGHVAVILEATAGDRFSLRVLDDGPGVPEGDLAHLVERGFRGPAARTRSPDGLGLGLNITLRVAEIHHLDLRFGPSEYGGLQVDLEGPRLRECVGQ